MSSSDLKKVVSFTKDTIYFEDGDEMFMPIELDADLTVQEVQALYGKAFEAVTGGEDIRRVFQDYKKMGERW